MALLIAASYKGISVPQAYAVVVMPAVSLDKASIEFGVWYKASAEHEHFAAVTMSAPYSLDEGDPFAQAYAHLKTLPEFEGSTDA